MQARLDVMRRIWWEKEVDVYRGRPGRQECSGCDLMVGADSRRQSVFMAGALRRSRGKPIGEDESSLVETHQC